MKMTRDSRIFATVVSGLFEGEASRLQPRRLVMCAAVLFLMTAFTARALADEVAYTNGPINGTINSFLISSAFQVADSFTLSKTATLKSVTFGAWNDPGGITTSVGWAILTSNPFTAPPPGGNVLPGVPLTTATVSSSPNSPATNQFGFDLNLDSFTLPGVTLGAGTYFLVLGNAFVTNFPFIGVSWDENNGPSFASGNAFGPLTNDALPGTTGSEAFTIFAAAPATVPEPGTTLLLGTALVCLRTLRRRRS